MADDKRRAFTRRDLLRRTGIVGVAVATVPASLVAGRTLAAGQRAGAQAAPETVAPAIAPEPLENLTAAEADLLEAIVARLIPSDDSGPGAREARAARYIDRALGGALASSRQAYASGLEALDRYARSSRGKDFAELSPADQDSVLTEVEKGRAEGFEGIDGGSASFFNMLLDHTQQGTFGDPYYGGNADFVGWRMIGYPGVRVSFSAAEQTELEAGRVQPSRRSAYDWQSFNKARRGSG